MDGNDELRDKIGEAMFASMGWSGTWSEYKQRSDTRDTARILERTITNIIEVFLLHPKDK